MNTPNPLLPQGTLPPRGKSSLYFKILMIFAVHIVVLGGILMVGCNNKGSTDKAKTDATTDVAKTDPMTAPSPDMPAPPVTGTTAPTAALPPAVTPSVAPTVATTASSVPPAVVTPPPATITPAAKDASVYVIASGDLLSTIAKKNGVSVKALEEANPGVDAKKLQIGHKLQIPASTAVASTDATKPGGDTTTTASGDATIYIVKSGDVLGKIAKAHNTSIKAIEALNDMKTTAIKTGQKLKVPVMKVASADAAPAPAATTPVTAPVSGTPAATPMVRVN